MSNNLHANWLKEGVKKWNYRRKKVTFQPDLSGIRFFDFLPSDFRDQPKASRFFERIDLSDANLIDADLSDLNFFIPLLLQNPKVLVGYDAEVV